MNRRSRRLLLGLTFAGLVVYGWLSWSVYRGKTDPENYRAWDGPGAWILGPSGSDLQRAADRRIDEAVAAIDELGYDRYREHLTVARDLLRRSLRAQPNQADAQTKLVAVSWELEPALTEEGFADYLQQIAEASTMAPHSPDVQFRLGKLLMGMWRQDEAMAYLRRTVELDATRTGPVAEFLLGQGLRPRELLDRLPDEAAVLAALGPHFGPETGGGERYLEACEKHLDSPTAELIRWYGVVCRRLRMMERLRRSMESRRPFADRSLEAERRMQRAWALAALDRPAEATAAAVEAVRFRPEVARLHDDLGEIALAAGDFDLARQSFADGIRVLSLDTGTDRYRAALYRKIGQLEDTVRRPDRAYDAYRMALRHDPLEPIARRRLREMRQASGVTSRPAGSDAPTP